VALVIVLTGGALLVLLLIAREALWNHKLKGSTPAERWKVRFDESLDLTAGSATAPPEPDFVYFPVSGPRPSRLFGLIRLTLLMTLVAAIVAAGLWEIGHLLLKALAGYVNSS
jgi:hypothetical protein